MRLLIIGHKGQLGSELSRIIKAQAVDFGNFPAIFKNADLIETGRDDLDITCDKDVARFIKTVCPDIIINCAAYTNVDACEENQELAFKINALGPRNLAIAAQLVGAGMIHISTDYVFDGKSSKPYHEADICNPQNIYGFSKYLGEQYVRDFCKKYTIIRTAWLYGHTGNNFVKTIIKAAKEKGSLKVVNDQRGNPTNAVDLCYHILKLASSEQYGIYHCTGEGECSWFEFACEIVRLAGIKCTIEPCTSAEYARAATRPAYSSLDKRLLNCSIGNEMRHWQDALRDFIIQDENGGKE